MMRFDTPPKVSTAIGSKKAAGTEVNVFLIITITISVFFLFCFVVGKVLNGRKEWKVIKTQMLNDRGGSPQGNCQAARHRFNALSRAGYNTVILKSNEVNLVSETVQSLLLRALAAATDLSLPVSR